MKIPRLMINGKNSRKINDSLTMLENLSQKVAKELIISKFKFSTKIEEEEEDPMQELIEANRAKNRKKKNFSPFGKKSLKGE